MQAKRLNVNKRTIYIASAIILILTILLAALDVRLKTVFYEVNSDEIQNPVRIALLTDLHSCKYGKGQKTLIDAIEEQKPTIVLLGGDICDDNIPNDNTEILLSAIADKYPCYYVTGNHEYWSGHIDEILDMFRSYGVTVLQGNSYVIEVNGQKICLSGIDDQDAKHYVDADDVFNTQLNNIEKEKNNSFFSILLAHRPCYIKSYMKYGFDLVLSGHEHGGQWRIPGILNGLYAPDEGWFPQYAGGQYIFKNGEMIVSRGLARESTRVPRLFNRPELVIVDLK